MSIHPLRPRTAGWLLPILPAPSQLHRAGAPDWLLLSAALCAVGAGPLAAAAAAVPVGAAAASNGRARSHSHMALLLGTIEGDAFCEGERELRVPAPPRMHGAPAAALVLSDDASFPQGGTRVEQVYVPKGGEWLMKGDRVRRGRMLELVRRAYEASG